MISVLKDAWRAAAHRLDDLQRLSSFDLRLSALLARSAPRSPLAAAIQRSAQALAGARAGKDLSHAVSALVGAGPGLTPSGDDLLSGLMAASRTSGYPGLTRSLGDAVERNLASTGDVSASLLRCAMAAHWPEPLVNLAEALARDDEPEALRSLDDLCALGHSSGADIATGFLFGLAEWCTASP